MKPTKKVRLQCKYCTETFGRKSRYNTHLTTKHNKFLLVKKSKCPFCEELFGYKSNATIHLKRTHKDFIKGVPIDKVKDLVSTITVLNPSKHFQTIIIIYLFIRNNSFVQSSASNYSDDFPNDSFSLNDVTFCGTPAIPEHNMESCSITDPQNVDETFIIAEKKRLTMTNVQADVRAKLARLSSLTVSKVQMVNRNYML